MRDPDHEIVTVCRRYKTGSFTTRAQREANLLQICRGLFETHPKLHLANLQARHVQVLVDQIKAPSSSTGITLSSGRQKNLLSSLRWLLEVLGKPHLLPKSNARLGVQPRAYVTDVSKAITVDDDLISQIEAHDARVAATLRLSREFGLRVEEALKFRPAIGDCGSEISLNGSWCKGGIPRRVPVHTASQRIALDQAHVVAGTGSLIPDGISYVTHLRFVQSLLEKFGIHRRHGLRHAYAQRRYLDLTGWQSPHAGGPSRAAMTAEQITRDKAARLVISKELGHGRVAISSTYLGSPKPQPALLAPRALTQRQAHAGDVDELP